MIIFLPFLDEGSIPSLKLTASLPLKDMSKTNNETISCFNHPFSGAFAVGFREGKLLELTTSSSVCDFFWFWKGVNMSPGQFYLCNLFAWW